MIKFVGSRYLGCNTTFLIFETEKGGREEIPLSTEIANFILARFKKLDPAQIKAVESPEDA